MNISQLDRLELEADFMRALLAKLYEHKMRAKFI
jgi:hypothetical protein